MLRSVKTLLLRSAQKFQRDSCPQMAAAIAYYVLFALLPLLIFLVGVTGLFLESAGLQRDIVDEVLKNIPLNQGEGRDTVTDAVKGVTGTGSGALGLLGLAGMAWSGSSLFGALRKALNVAFEDLESQRPFVQQKLLDLGLVLTLAVFFLVSIAATAFLRIVRARSAQLAAWGDAAETAGLLWDVASYLIPLALSFVAFVVLYTVVPSRLRPVAQVWPGALLAALPFEAAKIGFSFYLENFSNYDLVFGSLGAVASFLFWIYISANIMLFGAEAAAEYPRVRRGEYEQAPAGPKTPVRAKALRFVRGLFVQDQRGAKTTQ